MRKWAIMMSPWIILIRKRTEDSYGMMVNSAKHFFYGSADHCDKGRAVDHCDNTEDH